MKIDKLTLDNGLRVVHCHMPQTRMVALDVAYDVGARDEHPDHTGLAHLLEHLMFGGTPRIPDYDGPLQMAGGESNAWTNSDITNFYLTLPDTNVETGMWLESDRMTGMAFTPQGLEVQRRVVMEEFKQRCLNKPYGDVGHLLSPLSYKVHPYRWPAIGSCLEHVEQTTLADVEAFYRRFYAPDNAVLAIVGDIGWDDARRLACKWFDQLPSVSPAPRRLPQEPPQKEERRLVVERNVPFDALYMTFHMCGHNDARYPVFDLLSDVLANGASSRLRLRLVKERKLFNTIDASISGTRDAGLFHISGRPATGVTLPQAEEAVWHELELLAHEPVGQRELEKVKNKFESSRIFGNISYLNVAVSLAWNELAGKADDLLAEVPRYRAVTALQAMETAAATFRNDNASVLYYQGSSNRF